MNKDHRDRIVRASLDAIRDSVSLGLRDLREDPSSEDVVAKVDEIVADAGKRVGDDLRARLAEYEKEQRLLVLMVRDLDTTQLEERLKVLIPWLEADPDQSGAGWSHLGFRSLIELQPGWRTGLAFTPIGAGLVWLSVDFCGVYRESFREGRPLYEMTDVQEQQLTDAISRVGFAVVDTWGHASGRSWRMAASVGPNALNASGVNTIKRPVLPEGWS